MGIARMIAEREAQQRARTEVHCADQAKHDYYQAEATHGPDSAEALVAKRYWHYTRSVGRRNST